MGLNIAQPLIETYIPIVLKVLEYRAILGRVLTICRKIEEASISPRN